MQHLNQTQINSYYQILFDRLKTRNIINVPVQPDESYKINNCFNNVAKKVSISGGEICYGWAILPQLHILEAEKHAIWKTPSGNYIDITPRTFQISAIQFVIDDEFEYSGQIVGNIRINVTTNKVVDDWIIVCEAIDTIYANYATRIDEGSVNIPIEITPLLKGLEHLAKLFLPFIMNGGTPETVCLCGKPLFYKDCHGEGMQEAIAKDLAHFAEIFNTNKL